MIPRIEKRGRAHQLIVDDHPYIILGGELHNSSGASLADMKKSFARLRALNLNTVVAPVSWELIEPEEGRFDFHLIEGMIAAARSNGLKLVLLWFGAWKNGKSCYAPAWVKTDVRRFPRVETKTGQLTDVLSPFHDDIRRADATAFAALMGRVRAIDAEQSTVIMVQVENEVGILGQPRDFSAAAEADFAGPVPDGLMSYLKKNEAALLPAVSHSWEVAGKRLVGTWPEVFGEDADEIFMAWHLAGHMDAVAAAGNREYALPMYVNAWLKQAGMMRAGQYPSGGPISDMLDVWRAAAPHIAFLAPDIYVESFKEVCASYTRSGNPLFIPEAQKDVRVCGQAMYAIGEHAAMGFSPFAVDDLEADHPLGKTYALMGQILGRIAEAQSAGRIFGFYQETENDSSRNTMGRVCIHATSNWPRSKMAVPGGGFVIMLSDDECLAVGQNYWLEFSHPGAGVPDIELLSVEEGTLEGGEFIPLRRLNGDETLHGRGVPLREGMTVCRAKLNLSIAPIQFQPEWQFPT